jgi:serine/threonine-protein kinase
MTKLFVFFLLLPFCLFAQDTTMQWRNYQKLNFSIDYPTNWKLVQNPHKGIRFLLLSPSESPKDSFQENVNLVEEDISGKNLNLKSYTELTIEQIKSNLFQNCQLIESTLIKSDIDHHKLIYKAIYQGRQLKYEQYFWVIDNKAFVLTFTAEEIKFEAYKALAEKILNSFKIIRQENFS